MALVFFLALELVILAWIGDVMLRLAGYRSAVRTLPEFCVLLGLPAYALAGYLPLAFSTSAMSIVPGVVTLGIAAEWYLRRRPAVARDLTGPPETYRQFRSTWCGKLCWGIFALGALVVLIARLGWLTGRASGGMVEIGTRIYDDMRTIGFPLSLAALGFPLHNPFNAETLLMYPLGAFIYPTGMVAWLPRLALPIIVADTVVGALFYGMVMMLFAAHLTRRESHQPLAIVFALSCTFSVAFDWAAVPFLRKASFFPILFDYFKAGVNTTVGSTPLVGLVWVENHVLAFSALAAAGLLFTSVPAMISTMLVAFGAATSMDMTFFALTAGGLWTLWHRREQGRWPWRFMITCLVAAAIAGLVMTPGFTGKMDGLRPRGPSLLRNGLGPLGAVLSTEGPYLLIAALALPFAAGKRALFPLFAAAIAPLIFLLAFHYGSFWFWRGHFAMHPLLAILCAALIAGIPTAGARNALIAVWAVALLPGFWHNWQDIRWFRTASMTVRPAHAEAIRWIYHHTRLDDRVADWKTAEATLIPEVDYLRTGNRAGKAIYRGHTVVVGYQRNLELMSDLLRGIAANDYILYEKDDPTFERVLAACHSPLVFQTASTAIYHIEKTCRAALTTPAVAQLNAQAVEARARTEEQLRQMNSDPMQTAPDQFAVYLAAHSAEAGALARKRAESLWNKQQFSEAAALLKLAADRVPAVAEVQYSLGFSLQQMGNHAEAVSHFTRAMDLGYYEFWVRYHRGSSYAALGDKTKAAEDLKRAVQLDPSHPGPKIVLEALRARP